MRRMRWLAGVVIAAALWPASGPASAQEDPPVTDCDRLAALPGSVPGVPGVAFDGIDAAAAIAACEQAVRDHPGVTRFAFQYARALQRSGDGAAAARLYEWAAGDGLAPAQYELGRMLRSGEGVTADPDAAARWLTAAADQGYALAAEALAEPPPPPAPEPSGGDEEDPLALAGTLDNLALVLATYARDAPRSRFDTLAVMQPVGVGWEALTAWVGTEISLVPYRGSLRGTRGTLMDRHANSLDRALLLADLLAAAGHEVRLARATVNPDTAAALLDTFSAPAADEPPTMAGDELAARLAEAAGPYAAAVEAELAAAARTDAERKRSIDQRSQALTQDLLAALGDLPARAGGDTLATAVAALQDHWWVQVHTGDQWIDADPSAAVVGALTPEQTLPAADLPASLRHRVTLRLLVEFWEDGRLREETIFTHELVPAELVDRPIALHHLPLSAPAPEELLAMPDAAAAAMGAAAEAWVWQPVLTIGEDAVVDQLFTTRGDVLPVGQETMAYLGLDLGIFGDFESEIGDVFDEGGDAEPAGAPDEANAPLRVSAEWLEVTILVPEEAPVTYRRTVFDLIGPAARDADPVPAPVLAAGERLQRALALLREVDIMVSGAAPAASVIAQAVARDGADLMRTMALSLRSDGGWSEMAQQDIPRIPLPLYRHALERFDSAADGGGPFLDRPNVTLSWSGLAGTGAGDLQETLLFDIVANDVAAASSSDAFAERLAQGVRDTVTEHAIAEPGSEANGTAALYEVDRSAGRVWVRLDPAVPQALDGLDLPAEARAAIAADLAAGAMVIAPPSPVTTAAGPQVAWWRIDPGTGTTLGMTPDGGAVTVENATMWARGATIGGCFAKMAISAARRMWQAAVGGAVCLAGGVAGGVAANAGNAAAGIIITSVGVALGAAIAGAGK